MCLKSARSHAISHCVIFFSVITEKVDGLSSRETTECTQHEFLLSSQRWVQLCHYGLYVCVSLCKCVQGVSWEAITRAKVWLELFLPHALVLLQALKHTFH